MQALTALVMAALSAATPYLVPLLCHSLHIRLTAAQAASIQAAGAQAAYGFIVASASRYRDVAIRDAALAHGVQHVIGSVPEALWRCRRWR